MQTRTRIEHVVSGIGLILLFGFMFALSMALCSRSVHTNTKERLILAMSTISMALLSIYGIVYESAIIYYGCIWCHVTQSLLLALLFIDYSVPVTLGPKFAEGAKHLLTSFLFLYMFTQLILILSYKFASFPMQCMGEWRLFAEFLTIVLLGIYLGYSFYLCRLASKTEKNLHTSILSQAVNDDNNPTMLTVTATVSYQRRGLFRVLLTVLTIYASVSLLIEILLSINNRGSKTCFNDEPIIWQYVLLFGLWILTLVVKECTIIYVFFWSLYINRHTELSSFRVDIQNSEEPNIDVVRKQSMFTNATHTYD